MRPCRGRRSVRACREGEHMRDRIGVIPRPCLVDREGRRPGGDGAERPECVAVAAGRAGRQVRVEVRRAVGREDRRVRARDDLRVVAAVGPVLEHDLHGRPEGDEDLLRPGGPARPVEGDADRRRRRGGTRQGEREGRGQDDRGCPRDVHAILPRHRSARRPAAPPVTFPSRRASSNRGRRKGRPARPRRRTRLRADGLRVELRPRPVRQGHAARCLPGGPTQHVDAVDEPTHADASPGRPGRRRSLLRPVGVRAALAAGPALRPDGRRGAPRGRPPRRGGAAVPSPRCTCAPTCCGTGSDVEPRPPG